MILNQMPIDFDSLRMTDRQIDCNRTPSALRERFAAPNNELVSTALALVYTQEPVALLFCIPLVIRTLVNIVTITPPLAGPGNFLEYILPYLPFLTSSSN